MISRKMTALAAGSSVIRAMFEEGNRLAALYGRENVYDFSLGNPNFPSPEPVKTAIIDVVTNTDPVELHGYMSNIGYPAVRRAIAGSLNASHGTKFDEGNIIMSCGAAGALNVVLKTLLNPGDEVIVFPPYFVEYGNYINNYDGRLVAVPALADSFLPDIDALESALTPATKAVIINSPNNPTGVIYPEDVIRRLAGALERNAQEFGTPIYIISDEPYRELAYDGAAVPWLTGFYNNTIVCYSWSKSLSLPGERIGYIVIPSELDEYELIYGAAGIATRVLGFVNAPSLMQRVVAMCLSEKADINAYDINRMLLYNALKSYGYTPVFPQGAFYLWLKAPCVTSGPPGLDADKAFAEEAKKHNILLVPGSSFGCPGYLRIAYCVAKTVIEKSLPGFQKLAVQYGLSADNEA